MSAILGSLLEYVVVLLVLVAIAGLGVFIGIKWAKSKNAKSSSEVYQITNNLDWIGRAYNRERMLFSAMWRIF